MSECVLAVVAVNVNAREVESGGHSACVRVCAVVTINVNMRGRWGTQ